MADRGWVRAMRLVDPGLRIWRVRLRPTPAREVSLRLFRVTILLDGNLSVRTPQGLLRLRSGEGMFVPPGLCTSPEGKPQNLEMLQLYLSPCHFPAGDLRRLFAGPRPIRLRQEGVAARLSAGFCAKHPLSDAEMGVLLRDWVTREPDLADLVPYVCGAHLPPRLAAQARLFREGDEEDLRVEALAGLRGLSRFAFHRRFTREWGIPPKMYLQRQRLGRFLELLTFDGRASSRLPLVAGFPDLGRFYRYFHSEVGMNPGEFLREVRF